MPGKRRAAAIAIGSTLLTAVLGCLVLPRYEPIDRGRVPYPVERLAGELDPWLLAEGFADALVIEIDWVAGCKPGPRTLRGFERIVRRYVPADRQIEIVLDDEIPEAAWTRKGKHDVIVDELVDEFAGTVSRPEPGVEKRYVLFLPEHQGYFGISTSWVVERDGESVPVSGVIVARRAHEKKAKLWLSRDRFERGTLIHEFGHEFGLVTNDRHERVDRNHVIHCTGLTCLMAHPTPRVILRNAPAGVFNVFPKDYCKRCKEDIRRAQDYWRRQMKSDPGYRASREQARALRHELTPLWKLIRSGRFQEVLDEIEGLRRRFADPSAWAGIEARALAGLGREEPALAVLLRNLGDDPLGSDYWPQRWQAGWLLLGFGRHDEAIELFDRALMREANTYSHAQSTFVLLAALKGVGRHEEAVALIEGLLERGQAVSYRRPQMEIQLASTLRLAGRLEEADERVTRGMRDPEQRDSWLTEARALRRAQGRHDEAEALRGELLERAERRFEEATDPRPRWNRGWDSVLLLAESGDTETARHRARELEAGGDPEGASAYESAVRKASAWAALGELDRAAALIEALSVTERGMADPCSMETLEPLRRSRRHAHLFAVCPPRE